MRGGAVLSSLRRHLSLSRSRRNIMSYSSYGVVSQGTDRRLGLHPALLAKARPTTTTTTTADDERKPVVGGWIMYPGGSVARTVASAGFDFVLVDCEHGNIDDAAMHESVRAVAAEKCSPIVRIAAPDIWMCKRALDAGAHGIMCPLMSTPEDAARFVSYCKFPVPKAKLASNPSLVTGVRGVGSPFAPAVFGQTLADYVATANTNTFLCVQIETVEGLENCEKIAQVPGIDMLFIGPNDLCSSMGFVAGDHESIPEVQEAIARVLAACKKAGKYAGMFCTTGEQVQKRFEQGFDVMNLGFDVLALGAWHAGELKKVTSLRD